MKNKNIYLLLILVVFFVYIATDTKLGLIGKNYSFMSALALMTTSFISYAWCLEHAKYYKIQYPSKSAFIVALFGPVGVLVYFFRGFGVKQGLVNTLKFIGFILIVFIVSFSSFWLSGGLETEDSIQEVRINSGFEEYDNGNFSSAFSGLEDLAMLDNADAQGRLGWMYGTGNGVSKDGSKSVYWLTKAANQGDVVAQYTLAILYNQGELVQKNLKESIEWYKKASKQGHPEAQVNLGIMYATGEGVEMDIVKAKYWINKAYEAGYEKAKSILNDLNKNSY